MMLPADVASPSLSSSAEPPLSANTKPSSRVHAQPSLSADPFSSTVEFSGYSLLSVLILSPALWNSLDTEGQGGEGGEDTAMILPSLSARSEPSLSAEGTLIDDPFSSADEPSTTSINNQLSSSKKTFVPKPPQRRRIGIGHKKKESNYNYGAARASLNAPHAHHFQVYSAAVSSNINAIEETPPAISPTKEEVKAERDMLHSDRLPIPSRKKMRTS